MKKDKNSNHGHWWITKSKVNNYLFRDKVSETPDFLSNHYLKNKPNQKHKEKFTQLFNSNDDAYSLLVTDDFIDSVICHREFIIQTNVIGESTSEATLQIYHRFGKERPLFTVGDEYSNESGTILRDNYYDYFGISITIDRNSTIISVQVFSGASKKKRKYKHRKVSALLKSIPKAPARYALLSAIVVLLVSFIQIGRYTLIAERKISENNPNRYGNPIELNPIEIDSGDFGEKMAHNRIVAKAFINDPNLLTQIEINRLKELTLMDRERLLGLYRAFRHPETPDKKALIIESETTLITVETEKEFDNWILATFPE